MKEIVMLYVLKYGVEDTLQQIATGVDLAYKEYSNHSTWTKEGKRKLLTAGADIYALVNKLRREEEAAFASRVNEEKATNKGS